MEIMTIPAIILICAWAAQGLKATSLNTKWLPFICGLLGGLLGIASMYVVPDFAGNLIDAVAYGIASGLAATGAYEAIKNVKTK